MGFGGEQLLQARSGTEEQLLGVGDGDIHQVGNLLVRNAVDGVEVEDHALSFREFLDGFQQFLLRESGLPVGFVFLVGGVGGELLLQRHGFGSRAQVGDAPVDRDAGQPGVEGTGSTVGISPLDSLQEGLVREILRRLPLPDIPVAYRHQPVDVALVFP